MAAGSIPIYIGAAHGLPAELNDVVIDLSGLPRQVLHCPAKLTPILLEIAAMRQDELLDRQQACLRFMEERYEQRYGLEPFLKAFEVVLDALRPCASS